MDKSNYSEAPTLSKLDKALINLLQDGLPICENPFEQVAVDVGSSEQEVIEHLNKLLDHKVLSRFGPMYDATCLGGAFTLAALQVPEEQFEQVANIVNTFEEVAHNYRRDHTFNMWFVIATESEPETQKIIKEIEQETKLKVLNVPKLEEFYVGLHLSV